jgi:hypothetical protein
MNSEDFIHSFAVKLLIGIERCEFKSRIASHDIFSNRNKQDTGSKNDLIILFRIVLQSIYIYSYYSH